MIDPHSEEGMRRKAERHRRRQAELKRLAFELVSRPINGITEHERRRLVVAEAPRFQPEAALAKHVGDVDAFDYPDVLERLGLE
jgi:hypothetical protein